MPTANYLPDVLETTQFLVDASNVPVHISGTGTLSGTGASFYGYGYG